MATFDQWRARDPDKRAPYLSWLCGSDRILIEEVIDYIRGYYSSAEQSSYDLSVQRELYFFSVISRFPLEKNLKRVVVVREIQCLERWDKLYEWLQVRGRQLQNTIVVFVSDDIEFPEESHPSHAAFKFVQRAGSAIRCTNTPEQALAAWIISKLAWRDVSCDEPTAYALIRHVNKDLPAINSTIHKASILGKGTRLTADIVKQLSTPIPSDDFVDNLLATDRRAAYASTELIAPSEYGRTIGLLFSRLDLLGRLHRELQAGKDIQHIVSDSAAGANRVPLFLVRRYLPLAKDYGISRRTRCQRLLTIVDDAYQRGASDGILESLVALW
jgi:DNA polymerase III delta subunit